MSDQIAKRHAKGPRRTWRSRLFTFGLRALFIFVLLICVTLAAYVWLWQDLREQQAIERELRNSVKCSIDWSAFNPDWPDLHKRTGFQLWLIDLLGEDPWARIDWISCEPETEEQLQAVIDAAQRLRSVELLSIQGNLRGFRAVADVRVLLLLYGPRDENLFREVGRMTNLTDLSLARLNSNDDDLSHLKDLENLVSLSVLDNEVTSDSLTTIAGFKSLEELYLPGASIDDRNLELLQTLPALRMLDLSRTAITDAAVPKLVELQSLEHLEISDNDLSSAAIAELSKSRRLETLVIHDNSFTDDAIPDLAQLTQLKQLTIRWNGFSEEGVERLKQSLPQAEIDWP